MNSFRFVLRFLEPGRAVDCGGCERRGLAGELGADKTEKAKLGTGKKQKTERRQAPSKANTPDDEASRTRQMKNRETKSRRV